MDPSVLEIIKFSALGPVCALLIWLLVRADKREEKLREEAKAERGQIFEALKSMISTSSLNAEAMRGVQAAVEALKVAFMTRGNQ